MKLLIISIIACTASFANPLCSFLSFGSFQNSYSLNGNIQTSIPIVVERPSLINVNCNYAIGINQGAAASYDRKLFNNLETLDFQIYTDTKKKNILKDVQDTSNDKDLITGLLKKKDPDTKTEQAYVELTLPGSIQDSGMYSDTYVVNLYYKTGNTYSQADTTTINFNYLVPETISLSLVDSGAPHDPNDTSQILDFGIMETAERLSFDIVVKASDGYNLKFSSLNNGKLQHDAGNFFVDYDTLIDGSSVSLSSSSSSPVLVKTNPSATGTAGERTSVSITLGNVEDKVAGNYRDSVTITVESAL